PGEDARRACGSHPHRDPEADRARDEHRDEVDRDAGVHDPFDGGVGREPGTADHVQRDADGGEACRDGVAPGAEGRRAERVGRHRLRGGCGENRPRRGGRGGIAHEGRLSNLRAYRTISSSGARGAGRGTYVGSLIYGTSGIEISFDDRVLAHLELVINAKLRRRESFMLSWRDSTAVGDGRSSIWLDTAIPLYFRYSGSRIP